MLWTAAAQCGCQQAAAAAEAAAAAAKAACAGFGVAARQWLGPTAKGQLLAVGLLDPDEGEMRPGVESSPVDAGFARLDPLAGVWSLVCGAVSISPSGTARFRSTTRPSITCGSTRLLSAAWGESRVT